MSSVSRAPTAFSPDPAGVARRGVVSSGVGRLPSSDTVDHGGFTPGVVLAERYRIIGLLGRGGMGEVYRADDLKLGQPVALKFLPESLDADPTLLDRFLAEVRLARQVSHPNVCRVYDIGEVDGRHFLSMEYVDGEDLASLLKRIGRLGGDKAVEIAQQLCAGLAAAHDRGVLHRDLKPSNVMLDGRGRARITDFGLAVSAGEEARGGEIAGTPAYMAPEQLSGGAATVQSDLYSLGLVLYELFTGRRAFEATSLADWRRAHAHEPPRAPSTVTREMDPIVERVILRCLEKEPGARPRSAISVAAALPGGDPLAAALAAGETPSPEMVAAAGKVGGIRPAWAWAGLLTVLVGMVVAALLRPITSFHGRVPLEKPTDALVERSREIVRRFGYVEKPRGRAILFSGDFAYLRWVERNDPSGERWKDLEDGRPAAVKFVYRQAPEPMRAQRYPNDDVVQGFITEDDPPPLEPGMVSVTLDPLGRLVRFHAVPPATEDRAGPPRPIDWGALLEAAGLDPTKLQEAVPLRVPPTYADVRRAWTEIRPERPDRPLRVEAAGFRGRPVYFDLVWPWNRAAEPRSAGRQASDVIALVVFVAVLAGGALLARRNVRLGRADRRGAFRLASWVFAGFLLVWAAVATHVPTTAELGSFILGASWALFISAAVWVLYLALEPVVRRRWPESIISWSRLMSGSWRDPLVGRDVLAGATLGVLGSLWVQAAWLVESALSAAPPRPLNVFLYPLGGAKNVFSDLLGSAVISLVFTIANVFFFLLLRFLLRKTWVAAAAMMLIIGVVDGLVRGWVFGASIAVLIGGMLFVLIRFGILALVAGAYFGHFLEYPIRLDPSVWYMGPILLALLVLVGLAVYAFRIALAGRPALGRLELED